MSACPSCGRPIAAPRPTCLYCGAPLAATPRKVPVAPTGVEPDPVSRRVILVLDLRQGDAAALRQALDVTALEAELKVRRGGFPQHRVLDPEEAEREALRLARHGVRVLRVTEADMARCFGPVVVSGGRWQASVLQLDTAEGPRNLRPEDVLLVVRGPIVREYGTDPGARRVRVASLEQGYRFHLHRRAEPRPLELDPAAFSFPGTTGSSRLQLDGWIDAIAKGVPVDDAFKHEPPALGTANEPNPLRALLGSPKKRSARSGRGEESAEILDNLRQFRRYSALRGAVERVLGGATST